MKAEFEKKLSWLYEQFKMFPSAKGRIEFLNRALLSLDRENAEKWDLFRRELKNGELNADPGELQLSLEEEALAIGRVKLWLIDETNKSKSSSEITPIMNADIFSLSEDSPESDPGPNRSESSTSVEKSVDKKYMTTEEVADYLSISIHTIKDWAAKQMIPVTKLGKHNRFIREDIDNWVKNNSRKVIK